MAKKIKPGDLAKAISDVVNEYGDEIYEVLDDSVQEVTDEAVQKLHGFSHTSRWGHPWDEYLADWTSKKEYKKDLQTVRIIYNSDHYRLAHLLEFGHVKQNGGRTEAFPHIAPVNDWAEKELPTLVERKLK